MIKNLPQLSPHKQDVGKFSKWSKTNRVVHPVLHQHAALDLRRGAVAAAKGTAASCLDRHPQVRVVEVGTGP